MSSHVLAEVERVCDRIALLRKGELVLLAGLEAIRGLTARRVRVIFSRDVMAPAGLPPGHLVLDTTPRLWRLEVTGPLGPLLTALAGLPVEDMEVREARLEDVVLKYYRDGSLAETRLLNAPTPQAAPGLHASTLPRCDTPPAPREGTP
jgi:ABC-2 type transport system ATP-binding protein